MANYVDNLSRDRKWITKEKILKESIELLEDMLNGGKSRLSTLKISKEDLEKAKIELELSKYRLEYMEEIKSIVSNILLENGIKSKVKLCISDETKVEQGLTGYNLNIKLFEDGSDSWWRKRLLSHMGHEMSHIINGDVKNFTFGRSIVEIKKELNKDKSNYSLAYRAGIALYVLSECRSDLYGKKMVGNYSPDYIFNWFRGDKSYQKSGYLSSLDRKVMVSHFNEYNYNLVDYVFNFYFEKDGFVSREEVNYYIEHSKMGNRFKKWATALMNGLSA